MITSLQILEQSWKRLGDQALHLMPNVLAMLLILLAGWIGAHLVEWLLRRASTRVEEFLRRWGVAAVIGGYGEARPAHMVARSAYWVILGCAILTGINALNTELGTRLVTSAFFYLPRLAT